LQLLLEKFLGTKARQQDEIATNCLALANALKFIAVTFVFFP
jgi:hypothetical protein